MVFLQGEEHYIIGTFSHIGVVEAIVVAAHHPLPIQQYELLRMDEVFCAAIAGAGLYAQLVAGIVVDGMFIAGEEPPFIVVGIKPVCIGAQHLEAVVTGIYGDGYELHNGIKLRLFLRVFAKAGLQQLHAFADARAYSRAAGKDEVDDHHLTGEIFVKRYFLPQLVGEFYIGHMMVECIARSFTGGIQGVYLLYAIIAGHLHHTFGKMIDHKIAK